MNNTVKALGRGAIVLIFIIAIVIAGYGVFGWLMPFLYRSSEINIRAAQCEAATRPLQTRDIYILIDRTRSQGPDSGKGAEEYLGYAKDAVVEGLLPRFGPGDRVFAYWIGTGFDLSANGVFDSTKGDSSIAWTQDPVAPPGLPDCPASQDGERLCSTWEESSATWASEVAALELQGKGGKDPHGKSSYLDAFAYVGDAIQRSRSDEKWVVVIGDLLEHPAPRPFSPPEPVDDKEAEAFDSVRVVLVYPSLDRDARDRLRFWNEYFAKRGDVSDVVQLIYSSPDLRDPQLLMPVNPFCGASPRDGMRQ